MIYFKNLETNEIIEFQNENTIGDYFYNETLFKKLNEKEINVYLLQQAKGNKISELNNYYNNQKNWQITLRDDKKNCQLTETLAWFKLNLNCCIGGILLFDDKNNPVSYQLTRENIDSILNQCGFEFGYNQMKLIKDRVLASINSVESIDEISAINIENEFVNVNRMIAI